MFYLLHRLDVNIPIFNLYVGLFLLPITILFVFLQLMATQLSFFFCIFYPSSYSSASDHLGDVTKMDLVRSSSMSPLIHITFILLLPKSRRSGSISLKITSGHSALILYIFFSGDLTENEYISRSKIW